MGVSVQKTSPPHRRHAVLIDMLRGMNSVDNKKALTYGAHYSAVNERNFMRKELAEQLQAGHLAIFQWEDVKYLQGLWISHLVAIELVQS